MANEPAKPMKLEQTHVGEHHGDGELQLAMANEPAKPMKVEQTHVGEHHGDHGELPPVPVTGKTRLFAFCAALNSCNLGYDIGVSSEAGRLIMDSMELTQKQVEGFMGTLNLFAMLGALLSSTVSDRYGRRGIFIAAAVCFIVGVIIQAVAKSYGVLLFGRCFVGLGVGAGLAIDPVYISEISPASHRGRLVTWSEIATNIGILFGFVSGAAFYSMAADVAWRYMIGVGALLPSVMIVLAAYVMPESPRWLVARGRDEEARQILGGVYPPGYDVDAIIHEIKESIDREIKAEQHMGWEMILFPTKGFRRMLFVGITAAVSQQAIGIDAVQYFLVFIIEEAGIETRGAQTACLIFLGCAKLFFIVVGGYFFDEKGRRPMFFISLIGCASALLFLSFSFLSDTEGSKLAVVALVLYFASFSVGMGPGAWLVPSEVFAMTIRAKAMSVATFLNRVTATIMSSTFLTVAGAISFAGFFFLLAVICLVFLAFFYLYFPETKGRALEEMSLYFAEITGDDNILEAEAKLRAEESQSSYRELEEVVAGGRVT